MKLLFAIPLLTLVQSGFESVLQQSTLDNIDADFDTGCNPKKSMTNCHYDCGESGVNCNEMNYLTATLSAHGVIKGVPDGNAACCYSYTATHVKNMIDCNGKNPSISHFDIDLLDCEGKNVEIVSASSNYDVDSDGSTCWNGFKWDQGFEESAVSLDYSVCIRWNGFDASLDCVEGTSWYMFKSGSAFDFEETTVPTCHQEEGSTQAATTQAATTQAATTQAATTQAATTQAATTQAATTQAATTQAATTQAATTQAATTQAATTQAATTQAATTQAATTQAATTQAATTQAATTQAATTQAATTQAATTRAATTQAATTQAATTQAATTRAATTQAATTRTEPTEPDTCTEMGATLSQYHECYCTAEGEPNECPPQEDAYWCNTITFVANRLDDGVLADPCGAGFVCCCHCANCKGQRPQ